MVLRQDLAHVGVADPARPLEVAGIPGHRREPDQALQRVAVELRAGVGQRAEVARDRRLPHQVGRHVGHPVEPGRAAEQLGDGEQAVLRVLGRPEQARRPEDAGLEVEVGRDAVLGVRVADLVAQHLAQAAFEYGPVGEPGRGHEVGVVVRAGVVGPVDVQALRPALEARQDVGQQQRSRVGVGQPRVQHPARAAEHLLDLDAVRLGLTKALGPRASRRTLACSRGAGEKGKSCGSEHDLHVPSEAATTRAQA